MYILVNFPGVYTDIYKNTLTNNNSKKQHIYISTYDNIGSYIIIYEHILGNKPFISITMTHNNMNIDANINMNIDIMVPFVFPLIFANPVQLFAPLL